MRGLIASSLALMLVMLWPADAASRDLCRSLWVPEELSLSCRSAPHDRAIITPRDGTFAPLSQMTVEVLDRADDPMAFEVPDLWLREQMSIDTGALANALRDFELGPDSPIDNAMAQDMLARLGDLVSVLGQLPLSGCEQPHQYGDDRFKMACTYGLGELAVHQELRLIDGAAERHAVSIRTFNDRRLRHFQAIANSLASDD